jgi:hypothetical protein
VTPTGPTGKLRCESHGCRRRAEWFLEVIEDGRRVLSPFGLGLCDDHLLAFAQQRTRIAAEADR